MENEQLTLMILNKSWSEWMTQNLIKEDDSLFYKKIIGATLQVGAALGQMIGNLVEEQTGNTGSYHFPLDQSLVDLYVTSSINGLETARQPENLENSVKQLMVMCEGISSVIGEEQGALLISEWLKANEVYGSRLAELINKAKRGEFLRFLKRGQGAAKHLKIIH